MSSASENPAKAGAPLQRIHTAKEKAATYRQDPLEPGQANPASAPPPTLEEWRDVVSQRVEEAMRSGAFDNLRGRGKPLDARRDPFVPEDRQMAYDILKNNDLAPTWIGERNEVLREIARLREELRVTVEKVRAEWEASPHPGTRLRLEQFWRYTVEQWTNHFRKLNERITLINLKQPLDFLEIIKPRLEDELRKSGARTAFDWLGESKG
jgi:DnaJ family protein C protein 28